MFTVNYECSLGLMEAVEVVSAVLAAAERAKISLTTNSTAQMVVNYGEISEEASLKDVEMAQICASVLQRIYTPVTILSDSLFKILSTFRGMRISSGFILTTINTKTLYHLAFLPVSCYDMANDRRSFQLQGGF